jgi:hypothetical protein
MKSIRIYASLSLVSDFPCNMNSLVSPWRNEYPEELQEWRKPELINRLHVSLENARPGIGQAFAIRRRLGPQCLRGNKGTVAKNIVVLGSETVKSSPNGSSPPRCNCLRNIPSPKFPERGPVHESAAESRPGCSTPLNFVIAPPSVLSNANRAVPANACLGRVPF